MFKGKRELTLVGIWVATVATVGLLSACSSNHGNSGTVDKNTAPARVVILFPQGFRNVAAKCDGPNMVYSVSAGQSDTLPGGVAVVANDPRCK